MNDRRLRIGIDGFNLAMPHGTGVATYARTLAQCIVAMGHGLDLLYGLDVKNCRPELRETLFFAALSQALDLGQTRVPPSPLKRLRRAIISLRARDMIDVPMAGRVVSKGFEARLPPSDRVFSLGGLFDIAPRYFRRYGRFMTVRVPDPPDIMHWTYPLPIRLEGARNIYTIHDLVPLRLPYTSLEDKRYHDRLIRTCLATADHICTVSQSSRRDILELFPDTDPAKVTNTYQAVTAPDAALAIPEDELAIRLRTLFDLQLRGYFLYYGAIEPKKNVGRLIEAYLTADLQTPLVIVGARSWKGEHELRLLNGAHGVRLKGAERIRQLDYLPTDLLMQLVRGAKAVAFPSLYEGFGLPVLEAMTLGTPVLTSNTSSLPELVGNGGAMVDPYDVGAIAANLRALDADNIFFRQDVAERQMHPQCFDITSYSEKLTALYNTQISRWKAEKCAPSPR